MPDSKLKKVSVVIPTYNYGHYVCEAIDSVLNQSYPNIEIVVVDDGSKDNTAELLKKYGKKINYIYQENKGISAARNTGICHSTGEFIAFLDSDDIWLADKVEQQIKIFKGKPKIGLVSCSMYHFDTQHKNLEEITYRNYSSHEKFYSFLVMSNIVSGGSAAIVRKDCFQKVGMFDINLKVAEDWDMWLRINQYYDIHIIEKPLVKVRVGFDSISSIQNSGMMLHHELIVLRKQRKINPIFKNDSGLRMKAFSFRYNRAAWAMLIGRKYFKAFGYLLVSMMYSPVEYFKKKNAALMIRVLTFDVAFKLYQLIKQKKGIGAKTT